jgi:hypothetical protein
MVSVQFAPTRARRAAEPVLVGLVPVPCTVNTPDAGKVVLPPIPVVFCAWHGPGAPAQFVPCPKLSSIVSKFAPCEPLDEHCTKALTVAPDGTTSVGTGSHTVLSPDGHEYVATLLTSMLPKMQTAGLLGVTATPFGFVPVGRGGIPTVGPPCASKPLMTAALLVPAVVTNTAKPSLVNATPLGVV